MEGVYAGIEVEPLSPVTPFVPPEGEGGVQPSEYGVPALQSKAPSLPGEERKPQTLEDKALEKIEQTIGEIDANRSSRFMQCAKSCLRVVLLSAAVLFVAAPFFGAATAIALASFGSAWFIYAPLTLLGIAMAVKVIRWILEEKEEEPLTERVVQAVTNRFAKEERRRIKQEAGRAVSCKQYCKISESIEKTVRGAMAVYEVLKIMEEAERQAHSEEFAEGVPDGI